MLDSEKEEPVWYFAYGSNLKASVMEKRGLHILETRRALVPSHVLSFDVFGVPYREPAMASIAVRNTCLAPAGQVANVRGFSDDTPPVHGVAYKLSPGDFRRLVISEGAGIAYTEVALEADSLDAGALNDNVPSGSRFQVRTFVARYPFRPNPLPSARYLSLLIDGAEEHCLPATWQAYLRACPNYAPGGQGSTLGEFSIKRYVAFWMMLLSAVMAGIKASAGDSGRVDKRCGLAVWFLFNLMWLQHDWILVLVAGDGGRVVDPVCRDYIERCSLFSTFSRATMTNVKFTQRQAGRLMAEVPLIGNKNPSRVSTTADSTAGYAMRDGHNDFAYMIRGWFRNQTGQSDFSLDELPIGQTDVKRLRKGQLGGQFWSAFVPCPPEGEESLQPLQTTIQQIDVLHQIFDRFGNVFAFVDRSTDIIPAFRSGRLASLIGIEGLHSIGDSPSALRMFHRLGVRYATLCHNRGNMYCDSATSEAQVGGLSQKGVEIVKEMNRIGMIVDLSHTSHKAQITTLTTSRAPVIFSHSSCYTLSPSPRNVQDDVLELLQKNNGLIMICFIPSLVAAPSKLIVEGSKADAELATVRSVVDHIIYVGQKIGYAHVGIGSDFDGMLEGPEGLDDTGCYPALIAALLERSVSEHHVKMIMGLNIIRVLEEVEGVSQTARNVERWDPLCDEVERVWTEEQRSMLVTRGLQRKSQSSIMPQV